MILWGRNVYPVDDIEGLDAERLTRMTKQLEDAEESHRLNKEREGMPEVERFYLPLDKRRTVGSGKRG